MNTNHDMMRTRGKKAAKERGQTFWDTTLCDQEYDSENDWLFLGYFEVMSLDASNESWLHRVYETILCQRRYELLRFCKVTSMPELDKLVVRASKLGLPAAYHWVVFAWADQLHCGVSPPQGFNLSAAGTEILLEWLPGLAVDDLFRWHLQEISELILNHALQLKLNESLLTCYMGVQTASSNSTCRERRLWLEDRLKHLASECPSCRDYRKEQFDFLANQLFGPTLGGVIPRHEKKIAAFNSKYPKLYRYFLRPAIARLGDQPLYRFCCGDILLGQIIASLTGASNDRKDWILDTVNRVLDLGEELDEQSLAELNKKIEEYIDIYKKTKSSIDDINQCSYGLLGELLTLDSLWSPNGTLHRSTWIQEQSSGALGPQHVSLIPSPAAGGTVREKQDGKNCDFMISDKSGKWMIGIESKCKQVGYGSSSKDDRWDDFISSLIYTFGGFIYTQLGSNTTAREFSRVVIYLTRDYGVQSDLTRDVKSAVRRDVCREVKRLNTDLERPLLTTILEVLYRTDVPLEPDAVPLPSSQIRIGDMKQQASDLVSKSFIEETLIKAVVQLEKIRSLHQQKNVKWKGVLSWKLILPPSLVWAPYTDNSQEVAENLTKEIFAAVKKRCQQILASNDERIPPGAAQWMEIVLY